MYARKVNGRTLTLGVSGKLWEGSLIMIDSESESSWSHMLGEAMRGPLQGEKLTPIPSVMTSWKTWKSEHPATTVCVMPRTSSVYVLADMDRDRGHVIGLSQDGRSRTWDISLLHDHPVVNDMFGKLPVLVVFHQPSYTTVIYDRTVAGKTLTFEGTPGELDDRDTGSRWNFLTGVAESGPLKGTKLTQLHGIISDAAAWEIYHSVNSTTWHPPARGNPDKR